MKSPSENDKSSNGSEEDSVSPSAFSASTETDTTGTDAEKRTTSTSLFSVETRLIARYRMFTLIAIAIAAVACGTTTYFIVQHREKVDFNTQVSRRLFGPSIFFAVHVYVYNIRETYLCHCLSFMVQFTDYSSKIKDIIGRHVKDTFDGMAARSASITSIALAKGATFPNLTLPNFEVQGFFYNKISDALLTSFAPLVKMENKQAWDNYSVENQGWIDRGLNLSAGFLHNDLIDGGNHTNFVRAQIAPSIYRFLNYSEGTRVVQTEPGVQYGPGNYAPVWQQSPAPHDPSIINFDLLSHPVISRHYHEMWSTNSLVISEVMDLDFLTNGAIKSEGAHPSTLVLQPVYPSFKSEDKYNVAGILMSVIDWNVYFTGLFAHDNRKITIYIHPSCNGSSFTYLIEGSEATYLGEGDHHDSKYDYSECASTIGPYSNSSKIDLCVYDLHIYPTAQMEDQYMSNKPWIFALAVVIAFAFFAVVFVAYDYYVMLRQKKMEATANRTNAIVSSLFPVNVRDRILKNAEEHVDQVLRNKGSASQFHVGSSANQMKNYMGENKEEEKQAYGSKPIADLFPSATVMVRSRHFWRLRLFNCEALF
jgi:hypothetical protein